MAATRRPADPVAKSKTLMRLIQSNDRNKNGHPRVHMILGTQKATVTRFSVLITVAFIFPFHP